MGTLCPERCLAFFLGAALTGVAVSESVTGPYEYLDSFRMHPGVWPVNFNEEQQARAKELLNQDIGRKEALEAGVYLARDFEVL